MDNLLQTFNVNGVTLHYSKTGSGQPLIFLPGNAGDYRTWSNIYQRFADDGYECYVISRRFQYPSKAVENGDSSVPANTADIAAFIKDKNLSPVIVVGHSIGGFIALNLAIQHPELVHSVIAGEPMFGPALVRNPKNPLQLIGLMLKDYNAAKSFARLGMKGIGPAVKAFAKGDIQTAQEFFIYGTTDGKKTVATIDELTRQQLADNVANIAGEDPFNNNIKMKDLASIKCNVLLLSSTESPYVFQYMNEELKKRIPQAELQIISGAGHWLHIDQTDKFVTTVSNFLKSKAAANNSRL
ncbi:MAG: alpha/beta fold hydrolase [Chitinophagaceae bacterium]